MLTLVLGRCKKGKAYFSIAGFTLLELLVVLLVLSVAAGLIVVKGTPSDSRYLQAEAHKLSQLLRIAQQQSILKSREIRFVANKNSYGFEEFTGRKWVAVEGEPFLRTKTWDHGPYDVQLSTEGRSSPFLLFKETAGLLPQQLVLTKNKSCITLTSQSQGIFVVEPAKTVTAGTNEP